jgi:glycosyltransferase involved in cell wall biosynthesis
MGAGDRGGFAGVRILLVSSSSGSRGGGELYLLYLGRALAERGHTPILWASKHSRMDELASGFASFGRVERCEYLNTYDRRLRSVRAFFDSRTAKQVLRSWESVRADFIHLNKQNLEDGLDLLKALKEIDTPSLCTIHLTQSARYLKAVAAGPRDAVSRRALQAYPGFLVTVLENRRTDLANFLGDSARIRMVSNGVPLFDLSKRESLRAAKRRELGIEDSQPLIVAVGRLVPQKRPLVFLEQASRVLKEQPQARFLWVGDGGLATAWDTEIHKRGLAHAVQRMGWQMDVTPFLFAADLFLHVAEFEGLPLAILEAMSAALPCAISRNLLGEMPFFDEHAAIAVDEDAAWASVLGDPEKLKSIGHRSRQLAEEHFSFGTMAANYEALYRESIAAAR